MLLLDSNIIIYSIQPEHQYLRDYLSNSHLAISAISKVEVLGYYKLTLVERDSFQKLFELFEQLPIDNEVIMKSIELRQQRKMSLGDALVSATALVHSITLLTANVDDFNQIEELKLFNPVH
jgi:toxin FitB